MRRKLMAAALVSGFAMSACGSSGSGSTNAYDVAANQIDQAAAALTSATPEDTFTAMTQAEASTAGAPAPRPDGSAGAGGCDGDHGGKGPGGRGRGHGQGRGQANGGPGAGKDGQQALLWYADLTALQACRDQRTSCISSGDASTCDQAAGDCVKPVLEAAFTAFCSDELAMCSDANAPANACDRIKSRCANSGSASADAGM